MNKNLNFTLHRKMALLLAFSIILQISGGPMLRAGEITNVPLTKEGNTQDQAIIVLRNDKTVLVNGEKATNGAVIRTGSQIETLIGAEAEVQIPLMGSIKIFPKTKLTVNFSGNTINVQAERGCASLFTRENYKGVLQLPDGKTKMSEADKESEINSCDSDKLGGAGRAGGAGGAGGAVNGGLSLPVLVAALAGGAVIIGLIAASGDEPQSASPFSPSKL